MKHALPAWERYRCPRCEAVHLARASDEAVPVCRGPVNHALIPPHDLVLTVHLPWAEEETR